MNKFSQLFSKLFFFKIKLSKECGCPNLYEYKYFLQFDLNENDKSSSDILSIFKKLNETICDCNKKMKITKKLNSLPKYLILVINSDKSKTQSKFKLAEIDIKDFSNYKQNTKYELISFINKEFEPIYKSTNEKKWQKYGSKKNNEYSMPGKIECPKLLIYKQL